MFPVNKDSQRPSKYPTDDGLDFTGISFPTPLDEIPKVEKLNNIAINVLSFKNKKATIRHTGEMEDQNVPSYNIMLITKAGFLQPAKFRRPPLPLLRKVFGGLFNASSLL